DPAYEEELAIIRNFRDNVSHKKEILPVASIKDVQQWHIEAGQVSVHEDIETYILSLVRATREHPSIELGLSSRAALALVHAAQGKAFIEGRNFVTPDDVKFILEPVAIHRLMLTAEGMLVQQPAAILHEIVNSVSSPVEAF
ncbi:MAG: MoxR family ATPase, partial [Planococcus donghaensis]